MTRVGRKCIIHETNNINGPILCWSMIKVSEHKRPSARSVVELHNSPVGRIRKDVQSTKQRLLLRRELKVLLNRDSAGSRRPFERNGWKKHLRVIPRAGTIKGEKAVSFINLCTITENNPIQKKCYNFYRYTPISVVNIIFKTYTTISYKYKLLPTCSKSGWWMNHIVSVQYCV